MRKLLFLIGLLAMAPALAANEPFNTFVSGLSAASSLAGSELFPCIQSGVSKSCTPAQLKTYIGAVTDGSGTTTANEVTVSTTTAHTVAYAATLPTAAMPALTGDVTGTAGSLSLTVAKVNGAAVPTSQSCLGSNSSGQLIGCTTASIQVNGTNILGSPPNFTNSSATGGLTVTVTNASGGTVQMGLSGMPSIVANECIGGNSGATALVYQACSGSMVYPGAGIPQSTGSAWGTSITPGTGVVTALGNNVGSAGAFVEVLATGTQALGTSAIASGACATTIQVAITGASTSDTSTLTPTTDPNTVTGYKASASGALYVNSFMTSGDLNIEVCNNTGASVTPGAMSVHYLVTTP